MKLRYISILITVFIYTALSFGEIILEADVLEKESDGTLHLRGDVLISFDDTYFRTGEAIFDPRSKRLIFKNYFVLNTESSIIKGYSGWWDLAHDEGQLKEVSAIIDRKYYIKAKKLKKEDEEFIIKDGEFSLCPFEQRDWYIKASKISLKRNDYLRAYNLSFRFFHIPVIYTPYFLYPTSERKTGLLIPTLGQDTFNDFMLKIPIFYVINRNSDLTFTYDYRNRQGQGFDIEYRNRFNKKNIFIGDIFYFKEDEDALQDVWEKRDTNHLTNRWRINADSTFDFGSRSKLYFKMDIPSDPYFFEDYYNSSNLRYLSYTKSQLLAVHYNDWFNFELNFDYLYDLTKPTNEETLQRLPELRVYLKERKIKYLPFYVDFLSVNTNFYREKGERGFRSDNRLRLMNYFYFWRYSNRFTIAPRSTIYANLKDSDKKSGVRNLIQVEDVFKTVTIKPYKNFIHNIIPEVKFSYISEVSQEKYPIFDKEDRIDSTKDIDITLHNILTFEGDNFFRWSISTGYTFLGQYKISEKLYEGNFKPIFNSFYFQIGKYHGENNLYYNIGKQELIRSITSFYFPIKKWFEYGFSHSYDKGETEEDRLNQLSQNFLLRFGQFQIDGMLLNNIKDGYLQQTRLTFTFDKKCWKLKFKYIEDFNKETGKTYSSFNLIINLLDIEYAIPFLKPKVEQKT